MDFTENNLRRYLVILLAACGISLAITTLLLKTQPVAEKAVGTQQAVEITTADQLTIRLAQAVEQDDSLGIAAKDLKGSKAYSLADDRKFDAASTMKLLFVAYMYHQASEAGFDLDEEITIPSRNVQRYGTGSIQHESPPYRYSYRELGQRMMHESDNTAAFVLAQKFTHQTLQEFAEQQGMDSTSVAENTTTPRDMLKLMIKLYNGELANPELTRELLFLMRKTSFENRIPARLPEGTVVSHKTGDAFDGGLHDVGVVEYQGKTYAVAIYGDGLTAEDLAEMSLDIFTFMTHD